MHSISRRTFLVTTAGLVLAGCGGGDDDTAEAGSTDGAGGSTGATGGSDLPADGVLVFRQDTSALLTARPQRLVYTVQNSDGSRFTGGPATLEVEITSLDGAPISTGTGVRHEVEGQAYWTTTVELATEDNYVLKVSGTELVAAFTARDRSAVPIPTVGDQLVKVDTPTVSDGRGVDPVCTREPACPFHEVNLAEAIGGAKAIVLLIGTPAYCQTGICGPVLDDLMAMVDTDGLGTSFEVIHAEVYSARWEGSEAPPVTEAVNAFELSFEPVLYVARASGEIVARLDAVWDEGELREALALAAG